MTCERCPHEASIHLTETIDGRRREVHLCLDCARKAGMAPLEPPALSLDSVLESLILAHVGELVGELAQLACPACGLKFMEYRTQGRLGCPADYDAFQKGLRPLLRRAHGATRHVGKVPRRPAPDESATRLQLRGRLRQAIAREHYEEAARLRDLLRHKDAD
jgi:protein arginine kinase activator